MKRYPKDLTHHRDIDWRSGGSAPTIINRQRWPGIVGGGAHL